MKSIKYSLIHILKYKYEANKTMLSTCTIKILCQAKQEMHMNKKKLNINLVQHL
jgi:hypothetical protein